MVVVMIMLAGFGVWVVIVGGDDREKDCDCGDVVRHYFRFSDPVWQYI